MNNYLLIDIPSSPRVDGLVLPRYQPQHVGGPGIGIRAIDPEKKLDWVGMSKADFCDEFTPDWFKPGAPLDRECPNKCFSAGVKRFVPGDIDCDTLECKSCTSGRQRFTVRNNLKLVRKYDYLKHAPSEAGPPVLEFAKNASGIGHMGDPYLIVSKDLQRVVSG